MEKEVIGGEYLKIEIHPCVNNRCRSFMSSGSKCLKQSLKVISVKETGKFFGLTKKGLTSRDPMSSGNVFFGADGVSYIYSAYGCAFSKMTGGNIVLCVGFDGKPDEMICLNIIDKKSLQKIRDLVIEYNEKKKMEPGWKK